jgi:hypothetical protein
MAKKIPEETWKQVKQQTKKVILVVAAAKVMETGIETSTT